MCFHVFKFNRENAAFALGRQNYKRINEIFLTYRDLDNSCVESSRTRSTIFSFCGLLQGADLVSILYLQTFYIFAGIRH